MRLTRQGEYAIRAVLELAKNYQIGLVSAKEVAAKQDIPLIFLTKILSVLTKGGLVVSQRGNSGGIRLARPPQTVKIREVIEIMEGPVNLNDCLGGAGQCERKPHCKVHQMWHRAQQAFLRELDITLDQVI